MNKARSGEFVQTYILLKQLNGSEGPATFTTGVVKIVGNKAFCCNKALRTVPRMCGQDLCSHLSHEIHTFGGLCGPTAPLHLLNVNIFNRSFMWT